MEASMNQDTANKKLRLRVEDLHVDSFSVLPESAPGSSGTVQGYYTEGVMCTENTICLCTWYEVECSLACSGGGETCNECPTDEGETCQLTICGPNMC
jgi:hypothetical protein